VGEKDQDGGQRATKMEAEGIHGGGGFYFGFGKCGGSAVVVSSD
jgi:hypothetical protein